MKTSNSMTPIAGLYVITDTQLMNHHTLINMVEQALKGGAKWVQFRDKTSDIATKTKLASLLKTLCENYQAWLIINDDIQLAKNVNAHGVHIGKDDADISIARKILGPQAIIGVSCYNDLNRAKKMQNFGANYVAFGRFFASKTKPNAPQANIETLTLAKQQLNIPIVAIGGIHANNAQQLINAGADSLAVIQGVFAQQNIQQQSHAIQNLFTL
ncbi:thiamine phosphate synthase [Thiomicrorhabdus hydrogeniphila]